MRIGDEGRKPPICLPEPRNGAAKHQPPVDPDRPQNRAQDRRGKVALDQVLEAQEIVTGAGLPVVRLGLDAPGGALAVGRGLRAAYVSGELVQPAELPQFGAEHAVILRKAARIVSLHIDDMAVLNAHVLMIRVLARGLYQAGKGAKSYFSPRRGRLRRIRLMLITVAGERRGYRPVRRCRHWTSSGSVPV